MTPFAAMLLAGGQSRRMGRDKALLPLPDGRLLWERQLDVLEQLKPAELFISGSPRPGFPLSVPCLTDNVSGHGPLGGISATLEAMNSPRLVVLAVDLPAITTEFLSGLLNLGEKYSSGVVPIHPEDGFCEPLAAVYPKACAKLAVNLLKGNDWSLQNFVQAAGPMVHLYRIAPGEKALFANWNVPTDVDAQPPKFLSS